MRQVLCHLSTVVCLYYCYLECLKLHSFKFIQFTVIIANVSAVSDISGMHMKLNAADD